MLLPIPLCSLGCGEVVVVFPATPFFPHPDNLRCENCLQWRTKAIESDAIAEKKQQVRKSRRKTQRRNCVEGEQSGAFRCLT